MSQSLDWFSGSFKNQLQYYLGIFATPKGPQQSESVLYLSPLTVDSSGSVSSIQTSRSASPAASSWPVPNSTGLAVVRDPGGRLNLYYFNASGNQMQVLYLNTWSYTPGTAPAYQASTRTVNNNNIPRPQSTGSGPRSTTSRRSMRCCSMPPVCALR